MFPSEPKERKLYYILIYGNMQTAEFHNVKCFTQGKFLCRQSSIFLGKSYQGTPPTKNKKTGKCGNLSPSPSWGPPPPSLGIFARLARLTCNSSWVDPPPVFQNSHLFPQRLSDLAKQAFKPKFYPGLSISYTDLSVTL